MTPTSTHCDPEISSKYQESEADPKPQLPSVQHAKTIKQNRNAWENENNN